MRDPIKNRSVHVDKTATIDRSDFFDNEQWGLTPDDKTKA